MENSELQLPKDTQKGQFRLSSTSDQKIPLRPMSERIKIDHRPKKTKIEILAKRRIQQAQIYSDKEQNMYKSLPFVNSHSEVI